MSAHADKYEAVVLSERLRQGEVLTGFIRARQSLSSLGTQEFRVDEVTVPYLIVMSQDCDLNQDADARQLQVRVANDSSLLNDPNLKNQFAGLAMRKIENVLFCEATSILTLKDRLKLQKDLWNRITQNKEERYQCLEAVPPEQDLAGQGVPSLACDFKRFVTIPTDEVYKRLEITPAVRRARLLSPYVEHLLQRFCNFLSRIPLPEPHNVKT